MNWLIYAILSAFFAAVTSILAKIGINGTDTNLATAIRSVVILVVAWIIVLFQGNIRQLANLSRTTLIFLILSGLATGLSWVFYFKALSIGTVSRVVPVERLSLVLSVIMAAILLHEKLSWATLLGSFLITSGVLVMALWK